jgi:hypothetical protein
MALARRSAFAILGHRQRGLPGCCQRQILCRGSGRKVQVVPEQAVQDSTGADILGTKKPRVSNSTFDLRGTRCCGGVWLARVSYGIAYPWYT